jgi:L-lactate dehydrogenase complex protein LldG
MNARDAILAAVGGASPRAAEIKREAAALLDRVSGLRPDRVTGDPAEAFLARVVGPAIGATAIRVPALSGVPRAVRAYLDAHGLQASVALQPHPKLKALDWSSLDTHGAIAVDEAASVLIAPYAVAETGSLVFRSGPEMPVLFAFLPLHCLVVVEAASVVAWLEDCAAIEAARPAPRNLNLVTGASGTTDIEGALVRGAHGPANLHVIFVEPSNPQQ